MTDPDTNPPTANEHVAFTVDGAPMQAPPGRTIGAALVAGGLRHFRTTRGDRAPRGLFCGIGVCFDCLVTVNGVPGRRACQTPARDGDVVSTQEGTGYGHLIC